MEIKEMENIWREENERLKSRLYVNEQMLRKIHIDKSVDSFKTLYNTSVMGRNMALFYAAISLVLAFIFADEYKFSIPLVIGAAGMITSFIQHLALKRPKDYLQATIIELQKSIQQFRIHTMKHKYYDFLFVALWVLTLAPLYFKWHSGLDIYENFDDLAVASIRVGIILAVVFVLTFFIYRSYDKKLRQSIVVLKELEEFESE